MSRLIDADALITQIVVTTQEACMNMSWKQGMTYALGLVEAQPTITPKPHWISVTERLPEKNGEYTGEHTEFSDKQTHKKIEKEQRRAAKIINKIAETEKIQSLDEYYSLLPNVTDARRALPAREFFKGNYQQEAGYQQAKAEMTEQNRQEVAQKKSVSAQDVVDAKIKQYRENKR